MGNLHEIASPTPPTVRTLAERLVEMVESGTIASFAVAIVHRDGSIQGEWSATPSVGALLGSIARLSHRLNRQLDA